MESHLASILYYKVRIKTLALIISLGGYNDQVKTIWKCCLKCKILLSINTYITVGGRASIPQLICDKCGKWFKFKAKTNMDGAI